MIDPALIAAARDLGFPVVCALAIGWAFYRTTSSRIATLEKALGRAQDEAKAQAKVHAETLADQADDARSTARQIAGAMEAAAASQREMARSVRDLTRRLDAGAAHHSRQSDTEALTPAPSSWRAPDEDTRPHRAHG